MTEPATPIASLDLTRESTAVAQELLGAHLVVRSPDGPVTLRITETEAYAGERDPASHAFRGRTERNRVMFGPSGFLYVYRSHGLHWCCNVVTGSHGVAAAVLLRAGEVVSGLALARARRGPATPDSKLASGPGNLAKALGLAGTDNGAPLASGDRLTLTARPEPLAALSSGPRIGVRLAAEVPWRYWVTGDPTVSAYRRNPRAPGVRRQPPTT